MYIETKDYVYNFIQVDNRYRQSKNWTCEETFWT